MEQQFDHKLRARADPSEIIIHHYTGGSRTANQYTEGGRTVSHYNVQSSAQTRQTRKKYAEAPQYNLEPRSFCTIANVQHLRHPAWLYVRRPMCL